MGSSNALPTSNKYGVTKNKNAELDALTLQAIDSGYVVAQLQAHVDSLTAKSANLQALVATNEANKSQALSNKNTFAAILQAGLTLKQNSETAFNQIADANLKTTGLASNVKYVIDKLIYTVETINKLNNLIVRKKALNPLISDELVSIVNTAANDANNAVALTLVALQSAYVSQATNQLPEAISALEYQRCVELDKALSGEGLDKITNNSLVVILDTAIKTAEQAYVRSQNALKETNQQLNVETQELVDAQIKLRSYQAALTAANTAV